MPDHPTFCATRSAVPCGVHLAQPTVIGATGDGDGQQLEVAAALTRSGTRGLALTATDEETGRSVTVVLRHREVMAAIKAMLTHDDLSRSA